MRIYLAGPIFGRTDAECNDWRAVFKAIPGIEWLDPMARDYRGREDESVNEIVENDKRDIDSSDVLIAKVDVASAGTSMEILHAWTRGMPRFAICAGRVSPWVRYHTLHIFKTEQEAIEALPFIRLLVQERARQTYSDPTGR